MQLGEKNPNHAIEGGIIGRVSTNLLYCFSSSNYLGSNTHLLYAWYNYIKIPVSKIMFTLKVHKVQIMFTA